MTEKTKFEFRPMSFDEQAYSLFVRPLVMQDQALKVRNSQGKRKLCRNLDILVCLIVYMAGAAGQQGGQTDGGVRVWHSRHCVACRGPQVSDRCVPRRHNL